MASERSPLLTQQGPQAAGVSGSLRRPLASGDYRAAPNTWVQ